MTLIDISIIRSQILKTTFITSTKNTIKDLYKGKSLIKKLNSISSISTFFEFDSFLQDYKIVRSDLILKPFILDLIKTKISDLEGVKLTEIESARNKIVQIFDKLNLILQNKNNNPKIEKFISNNVDIFNC